MKITDVETILLTVPSKWLWGSRPHTFSFVRVSTDAGLEGMGETLLGFYVPELVVPLVEHFRSVVVGEDARDINRLGRAMFVKAMRWGHVGPAITVLGAIEMALWDILAKSMEVPLYQLLGGKAHERLRCYASTGCPAWPLEKTLDHFGGLVQRGYTALKTMHGYGERPAPVGLAALVGQERDKFSTLRKSLGDDVDLMLDPAAPFNREPWSADTALQVIQGLEEFHLLWVEQPVLQTNVEDYAWIRRHTSTPMAAGENGTTLHDLKPFFEHRAIDICQPDSAWCGGIGECMRIIAAAEAHDMRVAPHCFSGAVGLAANYHVALASRSAFIVEFPTADNPIIGELLRPAFEFHDGWLCPTGAPGLGVELPNAMVQKYPFVPGSGLSQANSPFPRPVPKGWVAPQGDLLSWDLAGQGPSQ